LATTLLTYNHWPEITEAVRANPKRCYVAVAYFGQKGSKLLPLEQGCRLVVDASEQAVSSGQTCPEELLKLVNKGVMVFSVRNLHAKVFVVGSSVFVGSGNVSQRSASQLVEAVIRSSEKQVVASAKNFVLENCSDPLTPSALQKLQKLYKPPKMAGGKKGKKSPKQSSSRAALKRLVLARLKEIEELTDQEERWSAASCAEAKKRQKHPRSYIVEDFKWTGRCSFKKGDLLIQITTASNGETFVSPPGEVLTIRPYKGKKGVVRFICLERPNQKTVNLKTAVKILGRGSESKLSRSGEVKNLDFAQALKNIFSRQNNSRTSHE
jgi:hypothetical protein